MKFGLTVILTICLVHMKITEIDGEILIVFQSSCCYDMMWLTILRNWLTIFNRKEKKIIPKFSVCVSMIIIIFKHYCYHLCSLLISISRHMHKKGILTILTSMQFRDTNQSRPSHSCHQGSAIRSAWSGWVYKGRWIFDAWRKCLGKGKFWVTGMS